MIKELKPEPPIVFTPVVVGLMAEANAALRALRALRVSALRVRLDFASAEITVNRNPHVRLDAYPRVRIVTDMGGRHAH